MSLKKSPPYCQIYKKIVEHEKDSVGLIAYSLYKKHKLEYCKNNPDKVTPAALSYFYRTQETPTQITVYRKEAEILILNLIDQNQLELTSAAAKAAADIVINKMEPLQASLESAVNKSKEEISQSVIKSQEEISRSLRFWPVIANGLLINLIYSFVIFMMGVMFSSDFREFIWEQIQKKPDHKTEVSKKTHRPFKNNRVITPSPPPRDRASRKANSGRYTQGS